MQGGCLKQPRVQSDQLVYGVTDERALVRSDCALHNVTARGHCACTYVQETLKLRHSDAALAAFDRLHRDSFGQVADLLDAKLQKGLDKQLADVENRNEVQSTRLCEQLESQARYCASLDAAPLRKLVACRPRLCGSLAIAHLFSRMLIRGLIVMSCLIFLQ